MMTTKELIDEIIDCAYKVREQLTFGFEEKIYKNAMYIEMKKHGLTVENEKPIHIYYDNVCIGDYRIDILVEGEVILELKAVNSLALVHSVQLVNYLNITGIDNGLLINFGAEKLEIVPKSRIYHKIQK